MPAKCIDESPDDFDRWCFPDSFFPYPILICMGFGLRTYGERSKCHYMKSAYELAMERLEKSGPVHKMSDAQKSELAEIGKKFEAKIAEREVFLQDQITKARTSGDGAALEQLQRQLSLEVRRLKEDCESAKEKVRAGKN